MGGAGYIAIDLPRCAAQFQSFLTITLLIATAFFMLDTPLGYVKPLLAFTFEAATFTPIVMASGVLCMKLFGLASGHPVVSAVETAGSYVLVATMLAHLLIQHEGMGVLHPALYIRREVLILTCREDV